MRIDEDYLSKIVRLFNEPDNAVLREEIEHLRALSREHDDFYREVLQLWHASATAREIHTIDVAAATQRLSEKLKDSEQFRNAERPARRSPFYWMVRVAAAVMVALAGYWIYTGGKTQFITKSTNTQHTDSVALPDGTMIFLDENTTVRYPSTWQGSERVVFLDKGNAFFSVTRDTQHPFVVQLKQASVKVLGTSFNINALPREVVVSVNTGTVMFTRQGMASGTVLKQGDGVRYTFDTGVVEQLETENKNADAWRTHELRFVDASLGEVLHSLETYYHVKIVLVDSIANFKKFNATFRNSSLPQVLEVLAAAYPVKIETQKSLVIIKGNP